MVGSIDGLASGLNTGEIISQLMAIERQGQTRLRTTQTQTESAISALRTINGKFLAIKTATDAFTLPTGTGFSLMTTTSSDPTRATATTRAGATPGEVTFRVDGLATTAVLKSTGTVSDLTKTKVALADLVLTKDGKTTTVAVGDGTLNSVVAGINNAKVGVTASAVQVSPGAYALQVTSTTSGVTSISLDGLFSADFGTVAQVTAGKDAVLQVGVAADGTGGYQVTRKTNTFDDLLPGTTIALLKKDTAPVTVRTTADNGGIADGVAKLVAEINAAAAEISRTGSYNASTKTAGVLLEQRDGRAGEEVVEGVGLACDLVAARAVSRDTDLQDGVLAGGHRADRAELRGEQAVDADRARTTGGGGYLQGVLPR